MKARGRKVPERMKRHATGHVQGDRRAPAAQWRARFPRAPLHPGRLDELPRRQGIRRPWIEAGKQKLLNENLAPLRRYLLSNVGRPWCKVFSEMSQHMRLDSPVQLHIWQHVQGYVCLAAWRVGHDYVDSRGQKPRVPFVVEAGTVCCART